MTLACRSDADLETIKDVAISDAPMHTSNASTDVSPALNNKPILPRLL